MKVLISILIQICICAHVSYCVKPAHVLRLVDQDGSLADLTMLSASSVDAVLPKEKEELQEKQEDQGGWDSEKERETTLVVVMDDSDMTGEKPKSFSDQRQSSTEESLRCSAGTEPEPSTEQSSGSDQHNRSINFDINSTRSFEASNSQS